MSWTVEGQGSKAHVALDRTIGMNRTNFCTNHLRLEYIVLFLYYLCESKQYVCLLNANPAWENSLLEGKSLGKYKRDSLLLCESAAHLVNPIPGCQIILIAI